MKKIISLFKRDYDGNGKVYDEVVSGAEWVINGEGVPTVKIDGTACMIKDGRLYKRYDRKLTKGARKRGKPYSEIDFKKCPYNWIACEETFDENTGHWPGWLPVTIDDPQDKWHREAWNDYSLIRKEGTYELIGPKIQGNPYNADKHVLVRHGSFLFDQHLPRDFEGLREFFEKKKIEGIVWHHEDGRMVKIKRRDFGFAWPPSKEDTE